MLLAVMFAFAMKATVFQRGYPRRNEWPESRLYPCRNKQRNWQQRKVRWHCVLRRGRTHPGSRVGRR